MIFIILSFKCLIEGRNKKTRLELENAFKDGPKILGY